MMKPTNWGYSVDGTLSDFITIEEFNAFTASKFTGDARIESNIKSATAAIRNYCGWHVYPELPCRLATTFFDRRVTRIRGGLLIQLPAAFVTEIIGITIDGESCESLVLETNGLLKVYNVRTYREYAPIIVDYSAGLPDDLMSSIKDLTAHRVTHALASSYGVTSEAAGGVSVTYNASWARDPGSGHLSVENKEILIPYRLGGVF